jgi:hypothetical protein
MIALRLILLAFAVLLAVAPAPAGMKARECLAAAIEDPDIAASFDRFDAGQSPAAARVCAAFLNDNSEWPGTL